MHGVTGEDLADVCKAAWNRTMLSMFVVASPHLLDATGSIRCPDGIGKGSP
jgi:hypothetical protein